MTKLYVVLTILMISSTTSAGTLKDVKRKIDGIIVRWNSYPLQLYMKTVLEPFNASKVALETIELDHPKSPIGFAKTRGLIQESYDIFYEAVSNKIRDVGTSYRDFFIEDMNIPKKVQEFIEGEEFKKDVEEVAKNCNKQWNGQVSREHIEGTLAGFYASCILEVDQTLPNLNAALGPRLPVELSEIDDNIKHFNRFVAAFTRTCSFPDTIGRFSSQEECYAQLAEQFRDMTSKLPEVLNNFPAEVTKDYFSYIRSVYDRCLKERYPKYKGIAAVKC